MRKEGLDLALRTASGTGQPGSGGFRHRAPRRARGAGRGRPGEARPPPRPRAPRRRGDPPGAVAAVPVTAGGGGPGIGRAAGRRLARAELSKTIYHPHEPLAQRILNGIGDLLSDLSMRAGRCLPWRLVGGGRAGSLLAALITGGVVSRTGPLARSRRSVRAS